MDEGVWPLAGLPGIRSAVKRRVSAAIVWLLVGVAMSIGVAWAIAFSGPGRSWTVQWARAAVNGRPWSVAVWSGHGWTIVRGGTPVPPAWSPSHAAGPPDTPGFGDIETAWASQTPDGQVEWLRLGFERAILPRAVEIHESFNPGAVTAVKAIAANGGPVVLWSGIDPLGTTVPGGVSTIPIVTDTPLDCIELTIDSPSVAGWNEIDAVALVDQAGTRHWAIDASASSTFARSPPVSAGPPDALRPRWSRSAITAAAPEDRVVMATGWPARMVKAVRTGAPARTFAGSRQNIDYGPPSIEGLFPFSPIWSGLLVNGVLFGTAARLLALGLRPLLHRPPRIVREAWRTRQGRCAQCGFDLRFELARGCPECGWRRGALP